MLRPLLAAFATVAALAALAALAAPAHAAPSRNNATDLPRIGARSTVPFVAPTQLGVVTPTIFQGEEAEAGIRPRTAKILMCGSGGCQWCTASILSKKYLLTAAHCVTYSDLTTGAVTPVESVEIFLPDETLQGSTIYAYKTYEYSYGNFQDDIALIKVVGRMAGMGRDIKYKLPRKTSHTAQLGEVVQIAGFGHTSKDSSTTEPDDLRQGSSVVSPCHPFYAERGFVCTKSAQGTTVICGGDSGGPMFEQLGSGYRILGVNSATLGAGSFCGSNNPDQMFTDVYQYYTDITNCFKNNCGSWKMLEFSSGVSTF